VKRVYHYHHCHHWQGALHLLEFALALVQALLGSQVAKEIGDAMLIK